MKIMSQEKQKEVLALIQAGHKNCDIAKQLNISPSLVSHYKRGSAGLRANKDYKEEVRKKLRKRSTVNEKGCWIFQGATYYNGYGVTCLEGKLTGAHRASYIVFKGPIPEGMFVCHTCDTRLCVNPDHLFLGTHQDNVDDMISKDRHDRGSRRYNSKLTESDVKEIRKRAAEGESHVALSKVYKVARVGITRIVNNQIWKHC